MRIRYELHLFWKHLRILFFVRFKNRLYWIFLFWIHFSNYISNLNNFKYCPFLNLIILFINLVTCPVPILLVSYWGDLFDWIMHDLIMHDATVVLYKKDVESDWWYILLVIYMYCECNRTMQHKENNKILFIYLFFSRFFIIPFYNGKLILGKIKFI